MTNIVEIIIAVLLGTIIGILIGSLIGLYKIRRLDKKMKREYQTKIKEAIKDEGSDTKGEVIPTGSGESTAQDGTIVPERDRVEETHVPRDEIPKRIADPFN